MLLDLLINLWSIHQVSPRQCHSFLWQKQMRKPWRTRASGNCCANWEYDHLQMNRCGSIVRYFTTKCFHVSQITTHSFALLCICLRTCWSFKVCKKWNKILNMHTMLQTKQQTLSYTLIAFITVLWPGDILEDPSRDQYIPAPECSCCSWSTRGRT